MLPRNQLPAGGSGAAAAQPPPNLYNYKPSTPAPTPIAQQQQPLPAPVVTPAQAPQQQQQQQQQTAQQQQQQHVSPRQGRVVGNSAGHARKSSNGATAAATMLMFQPEGPGSNTPSANQKDTLIDTSFMTPTQQLPPVPPRATQPLLQQPAQDNSPAAFSGSSPAPRPGEILIPSGAGNNAPPAGGAAAVPPVPPRSPLLQKKLLEASGGGGSDLLEFQRSPRLPAKSGSDALLETSGLTAVPARDDWEIEQDELVFEKEIASGTFGSVWKGQYQRTPCAIKKLHGEKLTARQLQVKRERIFVAVAVFDLEKQTGVSWRGEHYEKAAASQRCALHGLVQQPPDGRAFVHGV